MDGNVLKEYLVKLGFQVNNNEMQKMTDAFTSSAQQVTKYTTGMTKNFLQASTEIVGSLASITAATVGLIDKVSQADLKYQEFALQMHMSLPAAREMKIVLDAMGESMTNVAWIPELRQRYFALQAQARQLEMGQGAEGTFRQMRDLRFEVTRLKLESTYMMQYIAVDVWNKLADVFGNTKMTFKEFNDYITTHMPEIASMIGDKLTWCVKKFVELYEFIRDKAVPELEHLWKTLKDGKGKLEDFKDAIVVIGIAFIALTSSSGPMMAFRLGIIACAELTQDFYDYVGGKKSNPALAPVWKALLEWQKAWKDARINDELGHTWDLLGKIIVDFGSLFSTAGRAFGIDLSKSSMMQGLKQCLYAVQLIEIALDNMMIKAQQSFGAVRRYNIPEQEDVLAKIGIAPPTKEEQSLQTRLSQNEFMQKQLMKGILTENFDPYAKVPGAQLSGSMGASLGGGGTVSTGGGWLSGAAGASLQGGGGSNFDDTISAASKMYGVPENIIRQVIQTESSGNPNARSGAGAIGLMQLMPGTAADMGVNPYDPIQNIMGGTKYLAQMIAGEGGNIANGLRAYNGGPEWRSSGAAGTQENQQYAGKVLGTMAAGAQNFATMTGTTGSTAPSTANTGYSFPTSIGDIHVNISQPGASAEQVYMQTLSAVQTAIQRQNARTLNDLQGVHA
jgi:hypothetical protein